MGISCFGRDPVPNRKLGRDPVYRSAAAIKSCVPSEGWFSQGFYEFCDDSLVVAIYCPAGLSSLFISCGSYCTAVNHCKADSLVSSHKFKCWKKRFVYYYASVLQMWLFIELYVPLDVRMIFGKSSGNLNSVRNF